MRQMHQRTMDRNPGNPNSFVMLCDRSSSMSNKGHTAIDRVIPEFKKRYPGLRVFAFHADILEADYKEDTFAICRAWPERGIHKSGGGYCNTTFLGYCLEKVSSLNPCKTIVVSDGGVADAERALRAADNMPGDIDAYFCKSHNENWQDEGFMQELARRGRGQYVRFRPKKMDASVILQESLTIIQRQRRFIHERLPDRHIFVDRQGNHHEMQGQGEAYRGQLPPAGHHPQIGRQQAPALEYKPEVPVDPGAWRSTVKRKGWFW